MPSSWPLTSAGLTEIPTTSACRDRRIAVKRPTSPSPAMTMRLWLSTTPGSRGLLHVSDISEISEISDIHDRRSRRWNPCGPPYAQCPVIPDPRPRAANCNTFYRCVVLLSVDQALAHPDL